MGDIADSILDGEFDCITGEYIGEGCGYPRTMERTTHYSSEAGVVFNYLGQIGVQDRSKKFDLIIKYGALLGLQTKRTSLISESIRKDKETWKVFKQWVAKEVANV